MAKYLLPSVVIVPEGFPLKAGEVLRIHYPGTRRETRVRVGLGESSANGKHVVFQARSWSHSIGTNKESISLVGNERKLRRV